MARRTTNLFIAAALSLLTACGGSAPSKGPEATATAAAGRPASGDEAAARAAWDAAMKLRFGGDELGAQRGLVRLAADFPDTRYGRAATGSGGLAIVTLAGLGTLSAIAVPAYLRYVGRARSADARAAVERITDAAIAWHGTECARLGKACTKKFAWPASAPRTPAASACPEGRPTPQAAVPSEWAHPTWKALGISLDLRSHYQLEFVTEGKGVGAKFIARAVGDVDCDGVFATFERSGTLNPDGSVDAGYGMIESDELE
jgi:hypothetical protein